MKISYTQIKGFNPCYDPKTIGMPEDYEAELVDFVKEYRHKVRSLNDIFWVICRENLIDEKTFRLFACWCAREANKLIANPDPRSIKAIEISEKFANNEATAEELSAARSAAWSAEELSAARSAAESAAWSAAS